MAIVTPNTIDGHNINDGINYTAIQEFSTGLPTLQPNFIGRDGASSLLGQLDYPERVLPLLKIEIVDTDNIDALQLQLHQWFDNKDQNSKRYVVTIGGTQRYIDVVCIGLKPMAAGSIYQVFLVADGFSDKNYRFRGVTPTTPANWNISSSPANRAFAVTGHDEVYPVITITPTSGLTGGYSFKRWIPVRWRVSAAVTKYPVDITNNSFDTAALTPSKMQADGDDLRVQVGGSEVDRWLDGMNTTTTKVWVNLDFQAKVELTITASIASTGIVDTIDFNESISNLPDSGILMIDNEAFTYTSKNNSLKRVLGVARAARGTSMAAHSSGATAWWVQHDIWILYGNSTVSAPTVNDNNKPAFNLATSTNVSWDYDDFGEDDGLRSASWVLYNGGGDAYAYTGNQGGTANPWTEVGHFVQFSGQPREYVYNVCGIVSANFQNGEKRYAHTSSPVEWTGRIQSSVDGSTWVDEYDIPAPLVDDTWESWSRNETLDSGSKYVGIYLVASLVWKQYLEVADVTLALNSSNTPTITIVAEQGNYSLDALIENLTTGESIQVTLAMELNEDLEINTDAKTVTYRKDDSNKFKAVQLTGGPRLNWLRLVPGSNTLRYTQDGTGSVVFDIEWEERYYF